MASKNTERRIAQEKAQQEKKQEEAKKFIEEYKELEKKYNLSLRPVIKYRNEDGSSYPSFVIVELLNINNTEDENKNI